MDDRALRRLGVVFLVLLGLWSLALMLERLQPGVERLWPEARQARRLSLALRGVETVLARGDKGDWALAAPFAYPADGALVERTLQRLADAQLSEPLAGVEAHVPFQLTDAGALRLKGFLGGGAAPALELLVGKTGSDFDAVFVRRAGRPEVYEARGIARFELERAPGAWADKLLCRVPPEAVTSLEASGKDGAAKLWREGDHWLGDGRRLSAEERAHRLEPALKALAALEAEEVAPAGAAPTGALRVSLRYVQGEAKTLELRIGPAGKDGRRPVARADAKGVLYWVEASRLKPLEALTARARSPSTRGR